MTDKNENQTLGTKSGKDQSGTGAGTRPAADTASRQAAANRPDRNRRQLLQGAAAVPVVYTLAPRQVLANGVMTASILMSGNVSLVPTQSITKVACSPGYWKNNSDKCWEGLNGGITTTTLFQDVFSIKHDDDILGGRTLRQVLNFSDNQPNVSGQGKAFRERMLIVTAAHAVAAYLNASHSMVNGELFPQNDGYPLNTGQIVTSFNTAYSIYLGNDSSALEQLKNELDGYLMEAVCPLSNHCS